MSQGFTGGAGGVSFPITMSEGGTNKDNSITVSVGGLVYSTATTYTNIAGTATANQMAQSGASAAPTWSTATWPATTTINQLLWSSSANAVVGLTTANSSVLLTNGTGVPSWGNNLGTNVTNNITTVGTITSGTWNGSVIPLANGGTNVNNTASVGGICYSSSTGYTNIAGTATASKMVLSGASAAPTFSSETVPTSTTTGDVWYGSASNAMSALAFVSTATRYLSNTGGSATIPAWSQVNLANGVTGNLPVTNLNSGTLASSTTFWRGDGSWATPAGGGSTTGVLLALQVFTSSGTYTPTVGTTNSWVIAVGSGGGGGGSGTSGGSAGGAGNDCSFGSLCIGKGGGLGGEGSAASPGAGGAGGVAGTGTATFVGSGGHALALGPAAAGTAGAGSIGFLGMGFPPMVVGAGQAGGANTGAGGSGGGGAASTVNAGGGGGGGSTSFYFYATSATQTVTIGAGGTAGTAGASGFAGGAGAKGIVLVYDFK